MGKISGAGRCRHAGTGRERFDGCSGRPVRADSDQGGLDEDKGKEERSRRFAGNRKKYNCPENP